MRFLRSASLSLLLAAGAGCSAYLLERLRSSHISLAILSVVLTLAVLAYFATGRQEKGAWVRFGLYGAAMMICTASVWMEIVRPVIEASSFPGFVDRLTRLSGYELALIAVPPPGFAISFMLWFEVLIDSLKYLSSDNRRQRGRVRSLWQVEAARPKVSAPPRQTPGHPARPVGRGPQRQADRLVPGRLRHHRGPAPRRQGRSHRPQPAVARLPGVPGIDRHHRPRAANSGVSPPGAGANWGAGLC